MDFLKNGFFRNKKVLVTGHTGFKGSWLTQMLIELGARVCGYSLEPNTKPNLFNILKLKKDINHKIGDIRNFQFLNKTAKEFNPDIIFHLAAQPIVRDSYDNPQYTYEVNIMGTVNILEVIRLNKIKAGVIITTDKVYKNLKESASFREDDPLGGYDPYSNSKACADLVANSYTQSFFNPKNFGIRHNTLIASARAGNVIGGGDWAKDRLVPDLIRSIFTNKKKLVIRSPKAVRPWQHVLDPLFGYMLLAESLFKGNVDKSGAWNFGPKENGAKDVKTIVESFIKILGKGSYVIKGNETKHESKRLKLNSDKAKKKLGWQPKLNTEETVKKTASWYKAFYLKSSNMRQYTIEQIKNYFEK